MHATARWHHVPKDVVRRRSVRPHRKLAVRLSEFDARVVLDNFNVPRRVARRIGGEDDRAGSSVADLLVGREAIPDQGERFDGVR